MTSIDDIYSGRMLKAANVHQWPLVVTIIRTELVEYDDGKKQIGLHLREFPGKVLGLNKTNIERIRVQLGDDWENGWVGHQVTLVVENVDFQGKIVPAIRIQMPQPQPMQQPVQQPAPGSFAQAMADSGFHNDDPA